MDTSFLDQILDKVSNLEGITAYATMYGVLLTCGLGLPIPEDLTLITSGYLAYLENVNLLPSIIVCFFGVLSGDFILFMLGRQFGAKFFDLPGVRFVITRERVEFAQAKLKKNARKVCFVARFLAGLRAPIYLSAGTLVYVGYYFGDEIEIGLHYIRRAEHYLLITLAFVGMIVVIHALRARMRGRLEGES